MLPVSEFDLDTQREGVQRAKGLLWIISERGDPAVYCVMILLQHFWGHSDSRISHWGLYPTQGNSMGAIRPE